MSRGRKTQDGRPPKRSREKQIQAWFDPENKLDLFVLNYYDDVKASSEKIKKSGADEPDMSHKRFITEGAKSLSKEYGGRLPPPTTDAEMLRLAKSQIDSLNMICDKFAKLFESISSGSISVNSVHGEVEATKQEYQQAKTEYNVLEQSIASQYQVMTFDEDDE